MRKLTIIYGEWISGDSCIINHLVHRKVIEVQEGKSFADHLKEAKIKPTDVYFIFEGEQRPLLLNEFGSPPGWIETDSDKVFVIQKSVAIGVLEFAGWKWASERNVDWIVERLAAVHDLDLPSYAENLSQEVKDVIEAGRIGKTFKVI